MIRAALAASVIYGVCGAGLCTIDARTGDKQVVRKGAYDSVGASRSGAVLAWIRGEEVFRARRGGRGAERVGTALRQAAPEVNVRADGRAIAWIDVVQTSTDPLEPNLIELSAGDPPARARIRAIGMFSAGWLGRDLLRQAFGDGDDAPWFICALDAEGGCGPSVAVDDRRWLNDPAGSPDGRWVAAVAAPDADSAAAGAIALYDARTGRHLRDLTKGAHDLDPAFSPDGRSVAFVRRRDLWTVPAAGGRAKRLARGVASPAWAAR